MIKIENLTKSYYNKNNLVFNLNNINLKISEFDTFGIVGKSGSGKTTILNLIGLLENYDEGNIFVNNKDFLKLSNKDKVLFRKNIGYVFQELNLLSNLNVIDNICLPLKLIGIKTKERRTKSLEIMAHLGIELLEKRYPHQLSGGQLQRVAIARALINSPKILLCDEITSSLDFETTLEIINLLKSLQEELNLTIVFVTHDLNIVKIFCNKVAIIQDGVLEDVIDIVVPKNITNNKLVYKDYLLNVDTL